MTMTRVMHYALHDYVIILNAIRPAETDDGRNWPISRFRPYFSAAFPFSLAAFISLYCLITLSLSSSNNRF